MGMCLYMDKNVCLMLRRGSNIISRGRFARKYRFRVVLILSEMIKLVGILVCNIIYCMY